MYGKTDNTIQQHAHSTFGREIWLAALKRIGVEATQYHELINYPDNLTNKIIAAICDITQVNEAQLVKAENERLTSRPANLQSILQLLSCPTNQISLTTHNLAGANTSAHNTHCLKLSNSTLQTLFPFHLQMETCGQGRILSVGSALAKACKQDLADAVFSDHFSIDCPKLHQLEPEYIQENGSRVYFVSMKHHAIKLRGQMLVLDDNSCCYCATLHISDASSIEKLTLRFSDFAPHDTTLDIVMQHRYRELQQLDMDAKDQALSCAKIQRDQFSLQAAQDPLTKINNRRAFWQQCNSSLLTTAPGSHIAVLVIDLDRLKDINDEYGHHTGDQLLIEIANRLKLAVRPNDIVGRLGGDEFSVFLHASPIRELRKLATDIACELSCPIACNDIVHHLTSSIGGTIANGHRTLDDLISDADLAMYASRQTSCGPIRWFTASMRTDINQRRLLTQDLRLALITDAIDQVYQPIIDLSSNTLAGFEVLARWQHPKYGHIEPERFISIAQQTGLIPTLDRAMLSAALAQLQQWHQSNHKVGLQVNMSGQTIEADLPNYIRELLDRYNIDPSYLTLELTETCVRVNDQRLANILTQLTDFGVQLQLDDFGTGHSSLSQLQMFPISGLKIDRSLVSGMLDRERSKELVHATIALAKSLRLCIVAEGIESADQARALALAGCDYGQGFLYSKPLVQSLASQLLQSPWQITEAVDHVSVGAGIEKNATPNTRTATNDIDGDKVQLKAQNSAN